VMLVERAHSAHEKRGWFLQNVRLVHKFLKPCVGQDGMRLTGKGGRGGLRRLLPWRSGGQSPPTLATDCRGPQRQSRKSRF
jgi:hypothetical protein